MRGSRARPLREQDNSMTNITICGNTTAPAELRFVPSGKAVASWTVAVNDRRFDNATNE